MSICSIDDGPTLNQFGQSSILNKFGNSNSSLLNDQRDGFNFGSDRPRYQRPSFSDFNKGPNAFNTFGDRDKEL